MEELKVVKELKEERKKRQGSHCVATSEYPSIGR